MHDEDPLADAEARMRLSLGKMGPASCRSPGIPSPQRKNRFVRDGEVPVFARTSEPPGRQRDGEAGLAIERGLRQRAERTASEAKDRNEALLVQMREENALHAVTTARLIEAAAALATAALVQTKLEEALAEARKSLAVLDRDQTSAPFARSTSDKTARTTRAPRDTGRLARAVAT